MKKYINEDTYIKMQSDIYKKWFSENIGDKTQKVPYALTLYLQNDPSYITLLKEGYDENHSYNMDNPQIPDVWNFIAGFFLNKIDKTLFRSTPYEEFFIISDEGIISILGF
ncbi:MAG: hypothetical protein R3Y36_01255 [Spirochaetales bacterium]